MRCPVSSGANADIISSRWLAPPAITSPTLDSSSAHASGLICREAIADLGVLSDAEAADRQHVFPVTNLSDRPIRVLGQRATCSCTAASVPRLPVAAGKTADIAVSAHWAGKRSLQEATVLLETDSSSTPLVSLKIRGSVADPVAVSPGMVDFGGLRAGQSKTAIVNIINLPKVEVQVHDVIAKSKHLRVCGIGADGIADAHLPLAGGPGAFAVTVTAPKIRGEESSEVLF